MASHGKQYTKALDLDGWGEGNGKELAQDIQ
jgi:hypothetical protein